MINFIQLHQSGLIWDNNIITDEIYNRIHEKLIKHDESVDLFLIFIHEISIQYNTDKRNLLNQYFNYIVRNIPQVCSPSFLNIGERVIHATVDTDLDDVLKFLYYTSKKITNINDNIQN